MCQVPGRGGRLRAVLEEVGPGEAVERQGGLGAERDWAAVLSPGQLQALAVSRLLLAAPRFAFLEVPAERVETPLGERLYQALRRSPITYVGVGCPLPCLPTTTAGWSSRRTAAGGSNLPGRPLRQRRNPSARVGSGGAPPVGTSSLACPNGPFADRSPVGQAA